MRPSREIGAALAKVSPSFVLASSCIGGWQKGRVRGDLDLRACYEDSCALGELVEDISLRRGGADPSLGASVLVAHTAEMFRPCPAQSVLAPRFVGRLLTLLGTSGKSARARTQTDSIALVLWRGMLL